MISEHPMRRTFPALVAGALAIGALVLTTAIAPSSARTVTVDQRYPMPSTGKIAIVGHGYGHGHGMSQYGAEGAARQGLTWQQITSFYYPGTKVANGSGLVTVLVSADTSPDVVVDARAGLRVGSHAQHKGWTLPAKGTGQWRLRGTTRTRTRVEFRSGDTWTVWRIFAGTGSFYASGLPIRLRYGSTSVLYRGRLIAAFPRAGSTDVDTVNALDIDAYIKGVIPAEMPATWTPAAVQAQAVAARTYASYEKQHPRAKHYQICDTTACQVYGGYSREHPASNAAVDATRGRILTYAGAPAFTQFGSSSGGWTSANQFPYLPAKADPYDDWSGNANHDWRIELDVSRIEKAWPTIGNLRQIRVTSRDGHGQWQGRIERMTLVGGTRSVTIGGDEFRSRLGLKSTWVSFAAAAAPRKTATSRSALPEDAADTSVLD
ncbi:hypothetical protein ASD66_02630 [Nocardioides sp. Root151]|nr:hypothetical protein ASD66_02630 [Nocardioides sp. Root151]